MPNSDSPLAGAALPVLDPLYRLALLAHGPVEAEEATRQALGVRRAHAPADPARPASAIAPAAEASTGEPADSSARVALLAPLLLRQGGDDWSFEASARQLFRAGLTGESGQQLLLALAALSPAQRLALGLIALQGLTWERAQTLLEEPPAPQLVDPRLALGAALGVLPNDVETMDLPADCARCVGLLVGDEELDEASRQHLQGCQECQSYRKSWRNLNALLRTALPALFTTPPDVLQRLATVEASASQQTRSDAPPAIAREYRSNVEPPRPDVLLPPAVETPLPSDRPQPHDLDDEPPALRQRGRVLTLLASWSGMILALGLTALLVLLVILLLNT